MSLVSIIIPVGPRHEAIAHEAIASAEKQTVACEVIVEDDKQGTGPAAARNRAVLRSGGQFIIFLDSDDLLDPTYVETCLNAYQPGQFVYTDYRLNGRVVQVEPCEKWHPARVYHFLTTLMPRAMFDDLGGFSTDTALEDTDFYLRARFRGWYGVHVQQPLWTYRRELGTSRTNPFTATAETVAQALKSADALALEKYRRYFQMPTCGSCGPAINKTERREDDVLVMPLYDPRRVVGPVSGRTYPKTGRHQSLWVDPRDLEATAHKGLWQPLTDTVEVSPDVETVQKLTSEALATNDEPDEPAPETKKPSTRGRKRGRKSKANDDGAGVS